MDKAHEIPSGIDYVARAGAARATHLIARRWGVALGMYCVAEYPKSGGTWLARLLSDCLTLPIIQRTRLPIAMPSIMHGHWSSHQKAPNTVYVYRDGRDVMVSYYFHVLRGPTSGPNKRPAFLTGDSRVDLPRFIETEFAHPRSSRLAWSEHVSQWLAQPDVPRVSYENLVTDGHRALASVLAGLGRDDIDASTVDEALHRQSFQRLAKRSAGEEDESSFLRKGIVGDWRNHFTRASGQVFAERAGGTLRELGYEQDERWFLDLPRT